jgi:hypothetical protein
MKAKGRLPRIESMSRWKVIPALRSLNGMQVNSNYPEGGDNGNLGDVFRRPRNLQVAFAKVQLAKNPAAIQAGGEVGHVGQRILVSTVCKLSWR